MSLSTKPDREPMPRQPAAPAAPAPMAAGPVGDLDAGQVRYGGYTFEVIRSMDFFEVELLRIVDGIIIDAKALPHVMDVIRPIRRHSDRAIYLRPIFVHGATRALPPEVEALVDGHVHSLSRMEEATAIVERILEQEEAFEQAHSVSFEDNALTQVLRYLVSRSQQVLEPVASRSAKLGYAYPILDINFEFQHEHKTQGILDLAEHEQLLVGEFVDAWYVCSTCAEAHIHLREVCPDCKTPNLTEEPLVHHFRCAYVGPMSDFQDSFNVGDLICPKCHHKLNHVGVDYDKPASIFTCANGHTSQAPYLMARCFTCGTETQAEHLTKRIFQRYTLTAKGREKALTGVLANVKSLDQIEGTVSQEVFQTMLAYEVERVKVGQPGSTLAVFQFGNASELFSFIDRETRARLLTDWAALTRKQLQPSDVLAFTSFDTLSCLAPSLPPAEAEARMAEVAAKARAQIAEQFEGYEAHLAVATEAVRADEAPDVQLETLILSASM